MAPLADAVSGHGKAICLNGAAIYDFETETAHAIGGFLHDDMAAIVSDLRRELPGVAFALERASGAVFDPGFISSHPADATTQVGLVESFNDEPTGKLLARLSELPDEEFFSRVESIVGSRATLAYSGASGLAELSPAGISKAGALEQWCTEHGIDSRDVWAFGDMPNDIPMLSWAGRGIAVSNAHQDALAVADAITTSNDDDGVARALLGAGRSHLLLPSPVPFLVPDPVLNSLRVGITFLAIRHCVLGVPPHGGVVPKCGQVSSFLLAGQKTDRLGCRGYTVAGSGQSYPAVGLLHSCQNHTARSAETR